MKKRHKEIQKHQLIKIIKENIEYIEVKKIK